MKMNSEPLAERSSNEYHHGYSDSDANSGGNGNGNENENLRKKCIYGERWRTANQAKAARTHTAVMPVHLPLEITRRSTPVALRTAATSICARTSRTGRVTHRHALRARPFLPITDARHKTQEQKRREEGEGMTYVAVTVLRAPSPQLHPVRFFSSVGHSGRLPPAHPSIRPSGMDRGRVKPGALKLFRTSFPLTRGRRQSEWWRA